MKTDWKRTGRPFTHVVCKGEWVEVVAHIRCNETGEVVRYVSEEILQDGDDAPSPYLWQDGNNSCDCNREQFFREERGEDVDIYEPECSEGRFSVNLENPATGQIYYREFDDA